MSKKEDEEELGNLQQAFSSTIHTSNQHRSFNSLTNTLEKLNNSAHKTRSGSVPLKKSELTKKFGTERKKGKKNANFNSLRDFSFIKKEEIEDDSFLESPHLLEDIDEKRKSEINNLRKVLSSDQLRVFLNEQQKQKEFLKEFTEAKPNAIKKTNSDRNSSEESLFGELSEDLRKKSKKRTKKHLRSSSLPGTTENSDDEIEIERNTDKRFQKRFKLPDEIVIDHYICALLLRGALLSQGTMYITQNFLCFYSNIFGKKTRVKVPFAEMISVRKCRILKSIPNSIEVHTQTKKYFWASFIHRDNAYNLINSRWRECRTMLGDPILDDYSNSEELDLDQNSEEIGYASDDSSPINSNSNRSESSENLTLQHLRLPPKSINCSHQIVISSETNEKYSKVYPINVLTFYDIFFSDDSEMFWKEFHSRGGYQKFSMTAWSPSAEGCCFERHADFTAPLPLSIAPKYTRIAQQHRIRMIDQNQMIFETSSHSKDVPYSSNFLVEAKWILTNLDKRNCELKIFITVNFTKKIWLKSMIEHNAIEGSKGWYIDFIKAAMRYVKLRITPKVSSSTGVNRNASANLEILRKSLSQLPDDVQLNPITKVDKVKMKKEDGKEGIFQEVYKFSRLIQQSNPKAFLIIFTITMGILLVALILMFYMLINNSNLASNLAYYKEKNLEFKTTHAILKMLSSDNPEQLPALQNEFITRVKECGQLLDTVRQYSLKVSDHSDISVYLENLLAKTT